MEQLNGHEHTGHARRPPGGIDEEKMPLNARTLKNLQEVRTAVERTASFFEAVATLDEDDESLVTYAMWSYSTSRSLLRHNYLEEINLIGVLSGISYFETKLKEHLNGHYGWGQERIYWAIREIKEHLADDFRQALAKTRPFDETAQKVIMALDVWQMSMMKPIVNAIATPENKAETARVFCDDQVEPNGALASKDFRHWVGVMETSLSHSQADETSLQAV